MLFYLFFFSILDVSPAVHAKERLALLESFKQSWASLSALSDGKTPFRENVIEAQNYVQSIERILLHGFNFDLVSEGHVIDFVALINIFEKSLPPGYLQLPKSLSHRERTRAWIRLRLNDSTLSKSFLSLTSLELEVLGIYYKPWAFVLSTEDAGSVLEHLEMSETRSSVTFDFSPEDPNEFRIQNSLSDFLTPENGPPVTVVVSKKKKKKRHTTVEIANENGDIYPMANSVSVSGSVTRRLKKRQTKKHITSGVPVQAHSPGIAGSYRDKMHHSQVLRTGTPEEEEGIAKSLDPSLLKKTPPLRVSNIIKETNIVEERSDLIHDPSIGSFEDVNDIVNVMNNDHAKPFLCSSSEKSIGSIEVSSSVQDSLKDTHSEGSLQMLENDEDKPKDESEAIKQENKSLQNSFIDSEEDFVIVYSSVSKPLACAPRSNLIEQVQESGSVEVSNSFEEKGLENEVNTEETPAIKEEEEEEEEEEEKIATDKTLSTSLVETIDVSGLENISPEPFPKKNVLLTNAQPESENNESTENNGNTEEDLSNIFTMHVKEAIVIPDYESGDRKCTLYMIAKSRAERQKEESEKNDGDEDDHDEFTGPKYVAPDGFDPKLEEINYYIFSQPPKPLETVCFGCKAPFSNSFFDSPRYCDFTGHFFCSKCHSGNRFYIPARIVWNWDIGQYPVNDKSYEFLRKNFESPIVDLMDLNPELYESVPVLGDLKILRKKLFYMKDYIMCCTKIDPNDQAKVALDKMHKYYYKKTDLFSLKDFVGLDVLVDSLMQTMEYWLNHIRSCQLCLNMGSYCEICHSKEPIYMFQLRNSVQCEVCHGIFHSTCFNKDSCPKCKRRQARLIINSN